MKVVKYAPPSEFFSELENAFFDYKGHERIMLFMMREKEVYLETNFAYFWAEYVASLTHYEKMCARLEEEILKPEFKDVNFNWKVDFIKKLVEVSILD